MVFFSLAALADTTSRWRWLRVALGGLALGMAVSEGAYIGAIFSLYVAVLILYVAWTSQGHTVRALATGISRVVVVAALAGLVTAQLIKVLVATQIKGVGMQEDTQTKEERWDWATQWSLPKREALGYIIPGLFGYRMDTAGGGVYWGAMGRDRGWYRYWAHGSQGTPPAGGKRFSGGGIYAGPRRDGRFLGRVAGIPQERFGFPRCVSTDDLVLDGGGGAFVAACLGRLAPFYRLFYLLPYFSTIRNPGKFAHVVTWSVLVLFGYGLNGLWRRYMEEAQSPCAGLKATVSAWWKSVRGFDRRWTLWSFAALGTCMLGWLVAPKPGHG